MRDRLGRTFGVLDRIFAAMRTLRTEDLAMTLENISLEWMAFAGDTCSFSTYVGRLRTSGGQCFIVTHEQELAMMQALGTQLTIRWLLLDTRVWYPSISSGKNMACDLHITVLHRCTILPVCSLS
jgi:hypothetical protein